MATDNHMEAGICVLKISDGGEVGIARGFNSVCGGI